MINYCLSFLDFSCPNTDRLSSTNDDETSSNNADQTKKLYLLGKKRVFFVFCFSLILT